MDFLAVELTRQTFHNFHRGFNKKLCAFAEDILPIVEKLPFYPAVFHSFHRVFHNFTVDNRYTLWITSKRYDEKMNREGFCRRAFGFPLWGKLSPQVTDEGEPSGHFPLIRRVPRHLPPKGKAFPGEVGLSWFKKDKSGFAGRRNLWKN